MDEGEGRKLEKNCLILFIYEFNISEEPDIIIYVSVSLLAAQSALFPKIVV